MRNRLRRLFRPLIILAALPLLPAAVPLLAATAPARAHNAIPTLPTDALRVHPGWK